MKLLVVLPCLATDFLAPGGTAACSLSRNARALSWSLGTSTLTVMRSKSRVSNRREIETKPGNSSTHGTHQVAHTLITRSLFVGLLARAAIPAASTGSIETGILAQASLPSATMFRLVIHLVEHPIGRVISTGTGRPARRASIA